MLKQLGNVIQNHPWLVIGVVLILTLGFSTLIPSLEMRTEFKDFYPEDETVKANRRIADYFGTRQQIMFLYLEKENTESTITPQALREQKYIENEVLNIKEVENVVSINTLLDQICMLEFGETLENCTNEQLEVVINDIFDENIKKQIQLFDQDDPNEEVDYNRYPRLLKGKSIDKIDIKNSFISYDNDSITFTIEVYDLSKFESELRSPIPFVNVFEWFIEFNNLIKPSEELDISYKIAAHIEPKHTLWEYGKGPLKNIREILNHIKNRELFAYKKEVYLWIKPPGQIIYFPLPLKTANINLETEKNQIEIKVSREEIGNYGIAPRFGLLELPAKLSEYRTGFRYYQTYYGKLPWLGGSANTSWLFDEIEKIRNRPILSDIASRMLYYFANITWEDYDEMFSLVGEEVPLPDKIALKEMEEYWITTDISPDEGTSQEILFIRPFLFNEIKISAKAFLSKDFDKSQNPSAALIILTLNTTGGYEGLIEQTENILDELEEIDAKYDYVFIQATGENVVTVQMNEVTEEANAIIMPMIFIVILGILFVSFRKISYIVLPMVALVISAIWLFGTMVLLDIPFSTMSVVIIPLIMGLGVDYSVHLSHNYRTELSKGRTPAEAIKKSVLEIGTAMFLAMLTTVIAFLSFLSATLPPIRDLGLLLALGIIYTFITAITLQAAVRYVIDRRKGSFNYNKKQKFRLDKFMGILSQKILCHKKKIIVSIVIVTLIAGFGATQIKTGFDFDSFLPESNEAIELFEEIEENFPFASQNQEFILLEGRVDSVNILKAIMQTHKNLADDTFISKKSDGSAKASSIYTTIIQAVNNNLSLVEEFNLDEGTKIPKTNKDVKMLYDYLYESEEYGFTTKSDIYRSDRGDYSAAVIRIYISIDSEGREAADLEDDLKILYDELNDDLDDFGSVEATVTGPFVITHKITKSLTESQLLSTGISLVLATIVLIVAYRKPTLGLITIIPVLISIVWILGTMYFIGYSLNILTITVTSLTIGIGIDYAIHATERFKLVADKTGNITAAVCETISRTGGALLIAALTTALGFGILIFAPIPPEAQFGVITAMTITYSFVTSVLLLPLILEKWARWTKKRKGYIISPKPPEPDYLDDLSNGSKDKD
jgi:predicted RND superfamily exporter protein